METGHMAALFIAAVGAAGFGFWQKDIGAGFWMWAVLLVLLGIGFALDK